MVNRQRLIDEFIELMKIGSLSSKEGYIAKVLVNKLRQLGLDIHVEDAGIKSGGETESIIATLIGRIHCNSRLNYFC